MDSQFDREQEQSSGAQGVQGAADSLQPIFYPTSAATVAGSDAATRASPVDTTHAAPSPPDQASGESAGVAFMKGPKRKRLAKACDACHKSKRRCDGTAPCSNCFYAAKKCTYTDASGRSVPAPRNYKHPDENGRADTVGPPSGAPPSSRTQEFTNAPPPPLSEASWPPAGLQLAGGSRSVGDPQPQFVGVSTDATASVSAHVSPGTEDAPGARKRFRADPMAAETALPQAGTSAATAAAAAGASTIPPSHISGPGHTRPMLDPALTRELVNLFFAHCLPQRLIIHKSAFSVALSQNTVPSYLLNAMCALAAPFSKQPRLRTEPQRFAGKPFAHDAINAIMDTAGRVACDPCLAAAQALCFLQVHEIMTCPYPWSTRYHELALEVLEKLDVHKPQNPLLTPVPSQEYMHASLEKECIRRVFWFVYLIDLMIFVWFGRPLMLKGDTLMLRLPVDETSFELATHSTLSEYLFQPAPKTLYASEFGHVTRVWSIYAKIDNLFGALEGDLEEFSPSAVLEYEKTLEAWANTLPEHLQYSTENLQVQMSMFETSSNTSAWCFCLTHVTHSASVMALNVMKRGNPQSPATGPEWAFSSSEAIINALGSRSSYSPILGFTLWSVMKYRKRLDGVLLKRSAENSEIWGMRVEDFVKLESRFRLPIPQREQRSPPGLLISSEKQGPRREDHNAGQTVPSAAGLSSSSSPSSSPPAPYLAITRWPADTSRGSVSGTSARLSPPENRVLAAAGPAGSSSAGEQEPRQHISDADIDPVLQNGPLVGTVLRGHGAGDGTQSLPSLKASGLLDSWNPPGDGTGVTSPVVPWPPPPSVGPSTSSARADAQLQFSSPLSRRAPSPVNSSPRSPQEQRHQPNGNRSDADSSRGVSTTFSTGLPVGLQWLASESSGSRTG